MSNARIWVFAVDHGFFAFVRAPNGKKLVMDCGRKSDFSPTRYVYHRELTDEGRSAAYPVDEFVVSHPHDDHIEDIDEFVKLLPPRLLRRQRYNWPEIETSSDVDYPNLHRYAGWQQTYTQRAEEPDWGGMSVEYFYVGVERAKELGGDFINNSSYVVVATIGTFKIVFPGDLETQGWKELLASDGFRTAIRNPSVFVASHHGHDCGYVPEVFEVMGRPVFNLISCPSGDESVCRAYFDPERAEGQHFDGKQQYAFRTSKYGSCLFDVAPSGQCKFEFVDLGRNL